MAVHPTRWLRRKLRERGQSQWPGLCDAVPGMSPARLSYLRAEAQAMRASLDRFLMVSDNRMEQTRRDKHLVNLPGGSDWCWQPELLTSRLTPSGVAGPAPGTKLNPHATVWHDCGARSLVLRQVNNGDSSVMPRFCIVVEALGFTGSFLSLSIDLPKEALDGLTRDHVIRMESAIETERPVQIYGRLNIGNGPNTEEMLRHLGDMACDETNNGVTEFDLAMTGMNEKRLDKIWLDLIIERPVMNAVVIRDLILSRHPRANL
ncbi:hypothetical protein SAMN05421538_10845 [Paracoccus isoporae]|uniref:Uncharacterized protein n=1 Tax=Paracoccus isoporae TaxID=591205 RepID=A0A1G7E1A7_9RHOB|nr:DUF6478 family protein [Paracoccus isoporae]SDE57280.1 hypothetical protein SAMN05421538_10845 [Paracoccus isoporae]